MTKFAAILVLAFGLITPAFAKPEMDLGPPIGIKAPTIGTPMDSKGVPRSLDSVMGKNGTVLFFFRSAAWCPYCQAQLLNLNDRILDIEKRGYNLVGISYDQPTVQADFIAQREIKYTLLSDPKSAIIDRYNLRDPQYKEGSRAYGVPKPIIFILDRSGTIKSKLYEETYTKRPPVDLVIENLDKIEADRQ
jgi:peroxiredoxin